VGEEDSLPNGLASYRPIHPPVETVVKKHVFTNDRNPEHRVSRTLRHHCGSSFVVSIQSLLQKTQRSVVTCDSRMITVVVQSAEWKGMGHVCRSAIGMLVLGLRPSWLLSPPPPLLLLSATLVLVLCNRSWYWQGAWIAQSV
jgi:hypothetical protein